MTRIARARTALAALLLGTAIALPLAQGAAHAAGGPTAAQASLLGTWRNADPSTRSLSVIQVTYDAFWHKDRAAVWGRCHPVDCYWGTDTLDVDPSDPRYVEAGYHFDTDLVLIRRVGANPDVRHAFRPIRLFDPRPDVDEALTFVRSN